MKKLLALLLMISILSFNSLAAEFDMSDFYGDGEHYQLNGIFHNGSELEQFFQDSKIYGLNKYSVKGVYFNERYRLDYDSVAQLIDFSSYNNQWLRVNMPVIVPNGTDIKEAPKLIADWMCKHIVQDFKTYDKMKTEYQNAMSGFKDEKGDNTTYALAFSAMMNYLPINETTEKVEYTINGNGHLHYKNIKVTNTDRLITEIIGIDNTHRYYDIWNYQLTGKRYYLNMTDESLKMYEEHHMKIIKRHK